MTKDVFSVSVLALGGAINSIDTTPNTALYQAMLSVKQALHELQKLFAQSAQSNHNRFTASKIYRAVDAWFLIVEEQKEDPKLSLRAAHVLLLQLDVLLIESLDRYRQDVQKVIIRSEVVTASVLVSVLLEGAMLVYQLVGARSAYYKNPSEIVLTEMRTIELTLRSYKQKLMTTYRQYSLSRCW